MQKALILVNAFLLMFIWSGVGYYAFSLFVNPLQGAFGWERSAVMAAFTVIYLLSGLLSPLAGAAVHRWGAKKIIVGSALAFGAGLIGLSTVSSLWQFYLYSGLMGLGLPGIGPIPASTVVTQRFHHRRGHAIGIMSAGIGLGGLALSPLIGSLLIPVYGWRAAYIILGGFSWLATIPVTFLALRPDWLPAAPDSTQGIQPQPQAAGITLRQAFAASAFWLIAAVVFLQQISLAGAIQNQVPYLNDLGFPVALTALCLGLVGLMSATGNNLFGWLCDRMRANRACVAGMALQVAGILILVSLTPASPGWLALAGAVVIGLGAGGWLPTMSMMVSENLGAREYARIFGAVSFSQSLGTAFGPLLTSLAFDRIGDYRVAFICLLGLYLVAAPAALLVRRMYAAQDAKIS